ncbi:glucoamylase family protein [Ignavibacterium album]|uniref:glucoamylase family protein n=1 Tax=Ignavibacterium album TaxID=591197 RepID=UPI0026F0803E|nr:glucoamylase family protein [Ignavibacterium album]
MKHIETIILISDSLFNRMIILFLIIFPIKLSAQTDTIPPSVPQNVKAYGYERHIDFVWWDNEEPDLAGYKVYRKINNQWYYWTTVPKEKSYLMLSNLGMNYTLTLKVSAVDLTGNESSLSDSVVATTHIMSDDEFLDMTQRATFRYFWDYAHPVSGLARERLGSGETVTIGGSGFGIMALLVGAERGFKSRDLVKKRMLKIVNFLANQAQKFHGAFPHWMNGSTGQVIPFSQYDDGGDLVETAFLIQGLLAARQYFDGQDSTEIQIRNLITQIWQQVEWNWYRRYSASNILYWHWSPNYGWQMNLQILGPNECMIVYMLAIASPTYPMPASSFRYGWASQPYYVNGRTFYGYKIFVGWDYGGPLFFSHYSFLGFDPRNKKDMFCNYFVNNRNITLIHKAYCTANPGGWTGYNENCWGLTASDDPTGYRVHEPTNDNGTISPTAALSSMPYTPNESIEVLKHFYRNYYTGLWGEYGFKDAFNPTQNWFANSYLAIDQGPIIAMIENYRSGLLWNKFMANPEIQPMLDAIGFTPDSTTSVGDETNVINEFELYQNYPNPFNPTTKISWQSAVSGWQTLKVYDVLGREVATLVDEYREAGKYEIEFNSIETRRGVSLPSSIYFYQLRSANFTETKKMILMK